MHPKALVTEDLKQKMMIWVSPECGTSAIRRGNRIVGHPLVGDLQSSPNLLKKIEYWITRVPIEFL